MNAETSTVPPARRWKIIKYLLFLAGVIGLMIWACPYSEERWYEVQAKRLAKVEFTPDTIAKARRWQQNGDKWNAPVGRESFIAVGEDSAVCVTWSSFHDRERIQILNLLGMPLYLLINGKNTPPVSDAVLAIDPQGNFYKSNGHPCGILILNSAKEVVMIDDFLQTEVGTEDKHWQPYRPDK